MKNNLIVLDTNIWVYKTRMLSTGLGSALKYSLSQTKNQLVVPEIIEKEVRKHVAKLRRENEQQIRDSFRFFEQIMGQRDDYQLPSWEKMNGRVSQIFEDLQVQKIPFSFDHAEGALKRILDESPPNGKKNQQFKDSAIWEALLELAMNEDLIFVTEDNDFFKNRNPKAGLANNLKEDLSRLDIKISIYPSLEEYLNTIAEEIPKLDYELVTKLIFEEIEDELIDKATNFGITLDDIEDTDYSTFLTEDGDVLVLKFNFTINTTSISENINSPKIVSQSVEGVCLFNNSTKTVSDVKLDEILYKDSSGNVINKNLYARVSGFNISLGRKVVPYRLREDFDSYFS